MYYYNIYQISQDRIPQEDWITEQNFYMSAFLGEVADKITDVTRKERLEAISRLNEWLEEQGLGSIEKNVLMLNADMLNTPYYRERYQNFQTAVTALHDNVSFQRYLEDLDGIRNMIFEIENHLIQQQDHYVCWDSDNPMPLDEFLRTAEVGKPYYIGGVCSFKY